MTDPVKKQRHAFYQSVAWRNARASYLADHPLCVDCMREDSVTAATVVDHKIEIKQGGAMLDPANMQSLCASHHAKKTRRDGGSW